MALPHTSEPPHALDDAALVRAACAGEDWAYREIYHRHAPVILRRIQRVLGPRGMHESSDILQTVFANAFERLGDFDTGRSMAAWLSGFVFNVLGKHLRAQKRRAWLIFSEPHVSHHQGSQTHSPESRTESLELACELYAAVEQLSPKLRMSYALHELDGMGLSEIAAALGTSPQTIYARVTMARERVQKILGVEHAPSGHEATA